MYMHMLALLSTAVLVVLLGLCLSDMTKTYQATRTAVKAGASCILDAGWAKVANQLYLKSSMDTEMSGVKWFLALNCLFFAICFGSLIYSMSRLARLRRSGLYGYVRP